MLREFIKPSQIQELTEEEMNELWQWAYRTRQNKLSKGINGMPLLSIGRLIEFLIDYKIPLKQLMNSLSIDFHDTKAELVDVLWVATKSILQAPKKLMTPQGVRDKFVPKPQGTMKQWVTRSMWKQLTDTEMMKLKAWGHGELKIFTAPSTDFYKTNSIYDIPMFSIGRLLEYLTDNGMSLSEIFKQCVVYDNEEWAKLQLIDVLWDKVKAMTKFTLQAKE